MSTNNSITATAPSQGHEEPGTANGAEPGTAKYAVPDTGNYELRAVLDDTRTFLRRFLVLPEHCDVALALWVTLAPVHFAFETTPYIHLHSPQKGSGKTRTLEVLNEITPNTLFTANTSEAALFRVIDEKHPALLLDEADALFGQSKESTEGLRGLLNSGYRKGATVLRVVGTGSKMQVKEFDSFCPKVIASINALPDTIASRSIQFRMARRTKDEVVEKWRLRISGPEAHALRDRIQRIFLIRDALAEAEPYLPDQLSDRAQDIWEPLLAIAEAAGGNWPEEARAAALSLSGQARRQQPNLSLQLLADIRDIFDKLKTDRILGKELIAQLHGLEESPWRTLGKDGLTANALSRRLDPYDIDPESLRFGTIKGRGYLRSYFEDAWKRYLPEGSSEDGQDETDPTTDQNLGPALDHIPDHGWGAVPEITDHIDHS